VTHPFPLTALRRGIAALMLSAALVGTGMTAADAETLRWARVGDALTLDPHSANEGPTSTLLHHIYETLVSRGLDGSCSRGWRRNGRSIPTTRPSGSSSCVEGVKFHDGADFTAEDVVAS
jgi:peptide/nickel transport system substrate-binding protein